MESDEIREKFLLFFKNREYTHTIAPSSSLVPDDPSVLLTTAGMQQFKPYYLGIESPYGKNTVSIQKCFRTSDIDEVGDDSHLTFFEMLGNFSFGGYFKKEAIEYAYEFIIKEMGLKIGFVSVFEGDEKIEADEESEKIWKEIKKKDNAVFEIKKFGKKDNFWGPTGDEGPCGPNTEIYVRGVEVWNLVFNEYYKDKNGKYEKLKIKGVDTGMGLERLAMMCQNKKNIFETDLFTKIMKTADNNKVVADHIRGAIFLIADGITPSNVGRGYILRKLIRRVVARGFGESMEKVAEIVIGNYKNFYPELNKNKKEIFEELKKEKESFGKTFERGMKVFEKGEYGNLLKRMRGPQIFELVTTYGFPLESIREIAEERGIELDIDDFNELMKQHQELSRTASRGMFKAGLAGHSEMEIKYHTATHLLLAALRQALGNHVLQKGSNITPERLRLDFSHPEKLTNEQKTEIENLVNQKIKEDLPVVCKEMTVDEAKKAGALGVFEHKYGDRVDVFSIGSFSKEICGGPHAKNTAELGEFKIKKEEAISSGVRRIKGILK